MSQTILFPRRLFLTGGMSAVGLSLAGCQTYQVLEPIEPGYSVEVSDSVLPMINNLRASKGLKPLFVDPIAGNAAKDQAIRMARENKMSHFLGPDKTFLDRMKRLAVTLPAAENIAVGQDDTARAFDAWVRSKHHLDNMLGDFRGVGMAVARREGQLDRPFWAMCLSSPEKPVKVKPA